MRKKHLKVLFNALFLILIFSLTIHSVFEGENLKKVWALVTAAETSYVLASVVCVFAFILGESCVICYLIRVLGEKVSFRHCCLYSFIGFFYSCITPSASGGQPMQVIAMRKDGLSVAVSTVVLAIVTITYKLVLVVVGLAVMILRPPQLMGFLENVEPIIYLGIVLNVGCVAALLMLVFSPSLVKTLLGWLVKAFTKLHLVKKPEKFAARIERTISQYQGTADFYRSNHHVILHVFGITLLQRFALFLITWLVYCSFGLGQYSMPLLTGLQSMISVAVDMLPLPGGMGISENLFMEIFEPVFGADLVLPGMMLSRGISFYTQVLICGVMTLVSGFFLGKKRSDSK